MPVCLPCPSLVQFSIPLPSSAWNLTQLPLPPPKPPDSEGIITINHPHEAEPPEMCQEDQNEDLDSSCVLLGHAWGGRRLVWFEENFDFCIWDGQVLSSVWLQ